MFLKTSKQVCNKVKDQIEGVVEANALQNHGFYQYRTVGNFKPLDDSSSIPNQNQIENSNSQKTMDKEQEFAFGSVCAQLGLEKTSEVSAVITRIDALKNAENKAAEIQASYNALKIQKEGLDAQLTNVQNELTTVKNELKSYKDAEEAKRKETIEQFVDEMQLLKVKSILMQKLNGWKWLKTILRWYRQQLNSILQKAVIKFILRNT